MRTLAELAWAAGFYEGEGTIVTTSTNKGKSRSIRIAINQADIQPLEQFRNFVGLGFVSGPYKKRPNRKLIWYYQVQRFEHVQALLAMLWPNLSERRKAQARAALEKYHSLKKAIV